MTFFAAISKAATMDVVVHMAAVTMRRRNNLFTHGLDMAGITIHPFMSPLELEARLRVVVEVPDRPIIGVMTVPAFGTQALFMLVVRLMTAVTTSFRSAEILSQMTFLTRSEGMQTQ